MIDRITPIRKIKLPPTHLYLFILIVLLTLSWTRINPDLDRDEKFSFIVTADMRNYAGPEFQTSAYFMGACQAIKKIGIGAFMVSPGDIDPPTDVRRTISKILGDDYIWYPVVGNHETETPEDMIYLRQYNFGRNTLPNIVKKGPDGSQETMYSFDYGDAHFTVLNQYFDGVSDTGTDGDITEPVYNWLSKDLSETTRKYKFVFGHEPAYVYPDMTNGRLRHQNDCLNKYPENRDKFWKLLQDRDVIAYICGHTHNTSLEKIDGIYQIDVGHARGAGDMGAPSTFVKILIDKTDSGYQIYRDDANGGEYSLVLSGRFE